jgi:hypothetical protein
MDWTHSKPTYGTTTCKMAGFFGISKFGQLFNVIERGMGV